MVRSGKSFPATLISPYIGGLALTPVSVADNARVRAATKEWPVREVKKVLKEG
jgi:hypothetical protein